MKFHALPEELLAFVEQVMNEFSLHATAIRLVPFSARRIVIDELHDFIFGSNHFKRLQLSIAAPCIPESTTPDYFDKNPDSLLIDIGKFDNDGLQQSWLACRTDDTDFLAVCRKIAAKLKRATFAGVTGIDRRTLRKAFYRNLRYTAGAKSLESQGVQMLPVQGNQGPILKLGDIRNGDSQGP